MKTFLFSSRLRAILLACIGIGVLTFVTGFFLDPTRAWANFLVDFYFWLCVSLAGIFFVALQHVTGSMWSVPLRRIPETFVAYVPVAFLLFFVLLAGVPTLYEWSRPEALHDPLLVQKTAYLNTSFFTFRGITFLVICCSVGLWFLRNSLKQDLTGDPHITKRSVRISAPFILIFAWAFTFFSIDLIMSLTPHWYSTIFGVYCWAILFVSGVAMITLIVLFLRHTGYLDGIINENHLHDLGKLLFAFTVFWAYIGFSQFMLIWYANLPEETFYFATRLQEGWKAVSIAIIPVKFAIPLFVLISRSAKRNPKVLGFAALWLVAAQWLDVYWLVFPTFFPTPLFGWMEIGSFVGFAGVFLFCVGSVLSRVPLVVLKDPLLQEGLHHHQ